MLSSGKWDSFQLFFMEKTILSLSSNHFKPLLTKKDGCDLDCGIFVDGTTFQPLLTKKDGCDVVYQEITEAAVNFQPLLTKKDGCDGS
jgi:hypothetical protein